MVSGRIITIIRLGEEINPLSTIVYSESEFKMLVVIFAL